MRAGDKALRKASVVLEKHPESDLVDDAMFLAGRVLFRLRDYAYGARSFQDLEEGERWEASSEGCEDRNHFIIILLTTTDIAN